MTPFIAELIGTFLLLFIGGGVVANVVLDGTKGNGPGGWMVITTAWALAVYIGVVVSSPYSGAHLNPAVSVGLAVAGEFAWTEVPMYILAQVNGAFFGALATAFVLVFVVLFFTDAGFTDGGEDVVVGLGSLGALPVALLIWGIGLGLGGTTGYAINPARDFGPRLFHALAPIKGKGKSDWAYAWVPILGPLVGGALAGGLALVLS